MSWRAFISVDIEDADVLRRIRDFQALLVDTHSTLKLVEAENIHITLWFLGNITPKMAELIYERMKEDLSFKPFTVELTGVGAFPTVGRPRVVWVGVGRGSEELKALYEQLKPGLRKLGFRPDPKGFKPHVTVARVKRYRPELVKVIMENAGASFGVFRAEEVRLKKSTLTPNGPIYSTLYAVRARER